MFSAKPVLMIIMTQRNNFSSEFNRKCPYLCANPTYTDIPMLSKRAYFDLKIICKGCKNTFSLSNIDKHAGVCLKPKCACQDCNTLEEEMKQVYKVF